MYRICFCRENGQAVSKKLTAIIYPDSETDWLVAECPEIGTANRSEGRRKHHGFQDFTDGEKRQHGGRIFGIPLKTSRNQFFPVVGSPRWIRLDPSHMPLVISHPFPVHPFNASKKCSGAVNYTFALSWPSNPAATKKHRTNTETSKSMV
jgi:hypothetical protein